MILQLISYVGMASSFILITMAIACGLYYLSELVEEYTVVTKRLLNRAIIIIIGLLAMLWLVDGFPFKLTAFAIGSHLVYQQNLKRFPFISLTSKTFISSCILVLTNHYLWFRYFSDPSIPPAIILSERPGYSGPMHPPFAQVASFIGICVWLVPFSLFVSLSASDNVLPTAMESTDSDDRKVHKNQGLAKLIIGNAWVYLVKVASKLGFDLDAKFGKYDLDQAT